MSWFPLTIRQCFVQQCQMGCKVAAPSGFLFFFLLPARRADIVPRAVCVEKLSCDC